MMDAKTAVRWVQLGLMALVCLAGLDARALALAIRPIDFGSGIVASGSLVTDDTSGSLVDWNLVVRTTDRLAHYSRSNTAALVVDQTGVSADGQRLVVATSPDPAVADGGQLFFRSPNPFLDFGAMLADFTGAQADGGQAMYMAGAAFDFLALGAPAGAEYTVARRVDPAAAIYALDPLLFSGGVRLTGTIRTDGTTGALTAANILGWDLFVDQITEDLFNPGNSAVQATLVAFDPVAAALTTVNPGGQLAFSKGALGGRLHGLTLADFTDEAWPRGKAGYYLGRSLIVERSLGATGSWAITGQDPVPVPEPGSLALVMLAAAALWVRRHQRVGPRPQPGGSASR